MDVIVYSILFVRYGDFVPTTNASKALMTAWVLIGLVTMGVVTGVISSGMTVSDMEEELMLYGTPVCFPHSYIIHHLSFVKLVVVLRMYDFIFSRLLHYKTRLRVIWLSFEMHKWMNPSITLLH